ncbi:MAG TPA: helix-turn-helix domain-containing protein [Acidimicrobiales bacterium]|jgi:HTH-type transcriptional regulator/antitoxin HipB
MNINTSRDLAAAVRGRRLTLGLSQAELARRAGVSRPWLSKVEGGKPTAEFSLIIRLLDVLGLGLHLQDADSCVRSVDLDAILEDYES